MSLTGFKETQLTKNFKHRSPNNPFNTTSEVQISGPLAPFLYKLQKATTLPSRFFQGDRPLAERWWTSNVYLRALSVLFCVPVVAFFAIYFILSYILLWSSLLAFLTLDYIFYGE